MKNLFGYKYTAMIGVGLVLVLFFAVLIGSTFRAGKSNTSTAPTIIPTRSDFNPGGFEGEAIPPLSEDQLSSLPQKTRKYSSDQLVRLQRFDQNIPYYSQEFDIGYSKMLDQYFISLKSQDASTKFDEYLKESNLLDIRNVYRDLFVTGTDPVYNQMKQAEDEYLKNQTNP
ncbi:hypothetical protein A3G67_00775 [Candidatus Roizmanbacteria bacterium RIFCSPLOWO2_12_FULL_40_12]|uniref:Uncharacterized protein n=1 Tax=Candidatus Roizmanbacteria bacterium RIFCSPLOWO2_01_FULL_40_42 TaxID=1802066 RepID=A0A1F7J2U2_9BACT|nr:MAG: hypothetical protein A2779_02630 [Candidatus Roizmanbacteria bacterium RIFCSPHIGHO2_01_FULL_40_98]OGK28430.1 MAG: hypothetical protein A3C31_02945 [Candidatus Roizmanbacteria bacterium RIFCSPHIGHO2_02_FULL_40_53]OGK30238.1 MAG: hypothetical protein A2W49_04875 [Candidatus Roizmanbacteria bacterium RIFCSPHIGHO2_12_41_18]OGK36596.1 MAG: hypothetical protein A3E69_04640 [Candidatus Roizmanbacteria bacterium RIFCSPHIGHO2_12_FULL_40_130]OGK49928.1 MAG: hypothetical protein A3B50_00765 [Candi